MLEKSLKKSLNVENNRKQMKNVTMGNDKPVSTTSPNEKGDEEMTN